MAMDIFVFVMSALMIGAGAWVWYHENHNGKKSDDATNTTEKGSEN